jgi:hypothetical protein
MSSYAFNAVARVADQLALDDRLALLYVDVLFIAEQVASRGDVTAAEIRRALQGRARANREYWDRNARAAAN